MLYTDTASATFSGGLAGPSAPPPAVQAPRPTRTERPPSGDGTATGPPSPSAMRWRPTWRGVRGLPAAGAASPRRQTSLDGVLKRTTYVAMCAAAQLHSGCRGSTGVRWQYVPQGAAAPVAAARAAAPGVRLRLSYRFSSRQELAWAPRVDYQECVWRRFRTVWLSIAGGRR